MRLLQPQSRQQIAQRILWSIQSKDRQASRGGCLPIARGKCEKPSRLHRAVIARLRFSNLFDFRDRIGRLAFGDRASRILPRAVDRRGVELEVPGVQQRTMRRVDRDGHPVGDRVRHVDQLDLDGDGRLDVVLSKTVVSYRPEDRGGWSVYLNRR